MRHTAPDGQSYSLPDLMEKDINSALPLCAGWKTVSQRLSVRGIWVWATSPWGKPLPVCPAVRPSGSSSPAKWAGARRTLSLSLMKPTIGLHPLDVRTLLGVFQTLIEKGATVVVIEHDLDVIRNADYIIDMGPGGGESGGQIVAAGTPEQVRENPRSITGKYLR